MIVASTIVPLRASAGRAPPASRRLRRTAPWSNRAAPANGGNSGPSSRPAPPPPSDRSRQSRARPGCRTAHPPAPRRPARTIAAKNRSAASAPARSAAGRARLSDRAGQSRHQPRPRHHLLHLGQKLVAPRLLLLAGVFRLAKLPCRCIDLPPIQHRADSTQSRTRTGLFSASIAHSGRCAGPASGGRGRSGHGWKAPVRRLPKRPGRRAAKPTGPTRPACPIRPCMDLG